ncbi:MAG: hypothetical protein DMF64_17250 [Acidobacteria bacterium]|nr:MAG: hypothetical protein DMF64_17250 [Acidobacteriota bacterium]
MRSNYVRIWSAGGRQLVAPVGRKPGEPEQLLRELYMRAPWAEVGYTRELEQQWRKQRAEFLQRVEARRAQYGIN